MASTIIGHLEKATRVEWFPIKRKSMWWCAVVAFIAGSWFFIPIFDRGGTVSIVGGSMDIQYEVIDEPFTDNAGNRTNKLLYEVTTSLARNCDGSIERLVSAGAFVLNLTPRNFSALDDFEAGVSKKYKINLDIPIEFSKGTVVTYQAIERPACNWVQRIFPPKIYYPPIEFTVD